MGHKLLLGWSRVCDPTSSLWEVHHYDRCRWLHISRSLFVFVWWQKVAVNFWEAGHGRCVLLRGVCATDLNGNLTWYYDINTTASVFSLFLSFSWSFHPSFSLWFPLVPSFLCPPVTNMTHKKPLTIEMVLTPTRLHLIPRLYSRASGCVCWEWEGGGRWRTRTRRRRQPQLIYLFHVAFSPLKKLSGSLFSSCTIVLFSWVFCPSGGSI